MDSSDEKIGLSSVSEIQTRSQTAKNILEKASEAEETTNQDFLRQIIEDMLKDLKEHSQAKAGEDKLKISNDPMPENAKKGGMEVKSLSKKDVVEKKDVKKSTSETKLVKKSPMQQETTATKSNNIADIKSKESNVAKSKKTHEAELKKTSPSQVEKIKVESRKISTENEAAKSKKSEVAKSKERDEAELKKTSPSPNKKTNMESRKKSTEKAKKKSVSPKKTSKVSNKTS